MEKIVNTKRVNKWVTVKVIQQNYLFGGGWEDVSEYNTSDIGYRELLRHDRQEYIRMGYPTRVITRRVLNK